MTKLIGLVAGLALLATIVYFGWFQKPSVDAQPQTGTAGETTTATVSPGGDSWPRATGSPAEQAAATADALAEADALAVQGEYEGAMAVIGPHAAAGDEKALSMMGELNVQRQLKDRQERIGYLVKRLSEVPEENTAQRYAIVRDLGKLSPTDTDLAALRELYGELFMDELEAGLLQGQ